MEGDGGGLAYAPFMSEQQNRESKGNSGQADVDLPVSEQPSKPTVSIYQNPEHIEGILQQLFEQPVFTERSIEDRTEHLDSRAQNTGGKGTAKVSVTLPHLVRAELGGEGNRGKSSEGRMTSVSGGSHRGKFTQPYFLHMVRTALKGRQLIRRPRGRSSAARLRPGDFVEFTATFSPNQASALLDVLTPELVEAITRKMIHDKGMQDFIPGAPEVVQKFALELQARQDAGGVIARSATEAIRADFRATKTREFYGQVGSEKDALTFITMCEPAHFVLDDEDRILDGTYTVLAKVAGPLVDDEPLLSRNKLLERIHPTALDYGAQQLNDLVHGQMTKLSALLDKTDPDDDGWNPWEDEEGAADGAREPGGEDPAVFDFHFDSRIRGASIRVIPIAIFV